MEYQVAGKIFGGWWGAGVVKESGRACTSTQGSRWWGLEHTVGVQSAKVESLVVQGKAPDLGRPFLWKLVQLAQEQSVCAGRRGLTLGLKTFLGGETYRMSP